MKTFVATSETQGARTSDMMTCIEGELVWMVDPCPLSMRYPEGPCACGRTFSGMYSAGETSTALVRDIEGLTVRDYELALEASHEDHPGCTCIVDAPRMIGDLVRRADRWPVGAVVERRLDRLALRRVVHA